MDDVEIIIRREWRGSGSVEQRLHCPLPVCAGDGKRNLGVTYKEGKFLWTCFKCESSGCVVDQPQEPVYKPRPREIKPVAIPLQNVAQEPPTSLPQAAEAYFAGRHISPETALAAGVIADTTTVSFPYLDEKGQITALKVRGIAEKKFWQKGVCETYFRQPVVLESPTLTIVEGEIDCLSLMEIGITDVVSVPNGAPQKVSDNKVDASEDGKFRYVWGAKSLYESAKKIIIWTDTDGPGQALGEELARRIGKGRCWRPAMPDDCKDANDVLVKHGPVALREAYDKATPWPIQGVYDAHHYADRVRSLYTGGLHSGASTGFANLDPLYTVLGGHLCVVTGAPGSGKTAFVNQIMVNLAQSLDWKFAVQSTEIEPPVHIAMLAAIYLSKPFFEFDGVVKMTPAEVESSLDWVNEHFTFLESDGAADVASTIERLQVAVMRYGVRGVCIDPASYLRGKSGDSMDIEQVGHMLEEFKNFSVQHDCATWLIAHPRKMMGDEVPTGYAVSGSAHWYNRPDVGFTIHRPADNRAVTEFHLWKMRYSWIGKEGSAELYFDIPTGRYSEQPFSAGKVVYSAYTGNPLNVPHVPLTNRDPWEIN
ncbi:Archaeal primase DnaG/twinkle, TOPRIM domain [uncultured Caudovirales phage]|uniref:Archaeal primase DnaG/twinkle, TOPRIM domain n=1 Tax=uncultured Caudovirales phage TaxID=2100421 RepID=A0A6J5KKX3_9CAUD|nr:Archaeal primase DnaG/twinkle, TOPRIM domain [uncultured Caudovirales phage]